MGVERSYWHASFTRFLDDGPLRCGCLRRAIGEAPPFSPISNHPEHSIHFIDSCEYDRPRWVFTPDITAPNKPTWYAYLGALATMVASYLARARGSNEPELSIARVKDLEQFIRECEAFKMDHGHTIGDEFDHILKAKRSRFEELLGNANGYVKIISLIYCQCPYLHSGNAEWLHQYSP